MLFLEACHTVSLLPFEFPPFLHRIARLISKLGQSELTMYRGSGEIYHLIYKYVLKSQEQASRYKELRAVGISISGLFNQICPKC